MAASSFFGGGFFGGEFFNVAVVVNANVGGGARPSRRIHPRYIREYDPEDELPEVIQKRKKLTKKVEKLLAKQPAKTDEVTLDPFQTKAELQAAFRAEAAKLEADRVARQREQDDEDDLLFLMI